MMAEQLSVKGRLQLFSVKVQDRNSIIDSLHPLVSLCVLQCSAKNCRTAFHVTCGLHASLEMNTLLTEDDEVKFKSYCPKHSGLEAGESRDRDSGGEEEESARDKKGRRRGRVRGEEDAATSSSSSYIVPQLGDAEALGSTQQEKRVNLRKLKLEAMEEDFYQFVEVEEVASHQKLPLEVVDFLFQYWKLKRKANFNKPLLTPKKDEEDSLARREQEVLLRRLQLFTHLRQDLERVSVSSTCNRIHRRAGRSRDSGGAAGLCPTPSTASRLKD